MAKFPKINSTLLSLFVVTLILAILSLANYTPDTTLAGWDNLTTEMGNNLNTKRTIDSAWQEYQGVGLPAGLSHASDIYRQFLTTIISLALPQSLVRYFSHFIYLLTGAYGCYFLTKQFLRQKKQEKDSDAILPVEIASVSAALFYSLNLATMQMFYLPLETFTVHFAGLPWLFLWAYRALQGVGKNNLLYFAISNVLFAVQAYTATLFLAYGVMLVLLCLCALIFSSEKRAVKTTQMIIGLAIVTIAMNLSWLLPFGRFTINGSQDLQMARINDLASDAAFLQNKEYGNLIDIILLRGFWFGSSDITFAGNFTPVMGDWIPHLQNPIIVGLGVFVFIAALIGVLVALIKVNRLLAVWLAIGIFICFIMISAGNPPFGFIFDFLRENVSILKEALRFPFTKFSVLLGLFYSLGFSVTVFTTSKLIQKLPAVYTLKFTIGTLPYLFLLVIFAFPAFQGHFISPSMRVPMPDSYQELFTYMKAQPKTQRMALLPSHTHWGWFYHTWGYQGSGFLWYGIEQPILSRTFDVWSPYNEQFFREFRDAYYAEDSARLTNVLAKYDITWLLWDKSVFIPGGYREEDTLGYQSLQSLLVKPGVIESVRNFGEEIELYKVKSIEPSRTFVQVADKVTPKAATPHWYTHDSAANLGYYTSTDYTLETPFQTNNAINNNYPFVIDEANSELRYTAAKPFRYINVPIAQKLTYTGLQQGQELVIFVQLINSIGQTTTIASTRMAMPHRDFYVVINGTVYGRFNINNLNQRFSIGEGGIRQSRNFDVRIYEGFDDNRTVVRAQEMRFANCNPNKPSGKVDQQSREQSRLRVYIENTAGCSITPLYRLALTDRSMLAETTINYQTPPGSLTYCFNNAQGCVTQPHGVPIKQQFSSYIDAVEIGLVERDSGLTISVDNSSENSKLITADLGNTEVRFFQLLGFATFDSTLDVNTFTNTVNQTSLANSQSVTVPFKSVLNYSFDNLNMIDQSASCFDAASVTNEQAGTRTYTRVRTNDGSNVCLSIDLGNLATDESYLIAFDGVLLSGRAPELCVLEMRSNTCSVLEQIVTTTGEWKRVYYFIPPRANNTKQGYRLQLFNWSAGKSNFDFAYDNLNIYQISNRNFQSMKLAVSLDDIYVNAKYTNLAAQHTVPSSYQVNVSEMPSSANYVILRQGYDPGWLMLTDKTSTNDWINALLGRNGGGQAQPQEFNGWANVWVLPQQSGANYNFTLYFAPQLLVNVGWLITAITLLLLSFSAITYSLLPKRR